MQSGQNENLIQIHSKYFTAGIVLEGDTVVRAAPIIKWMIGWPRQRVIDYSFMKGWNWFYCSGRVDNMEAGC
jgi:hypothetical protein